MKDMQLLEITADNFEEEVVRSPGPVLVYFRNAWNKACREAAPVLGQLAEEWTGRLKVGSVDGDSQAELVARFRILNMPAVILFRRGEQLARLTGALTVEDYERMLSSHLPEYRPVEAEAQRYRDTCSDTWVATDRLGREVATLQNAGLPRRDKYIAMFYFINFGDEGPSGPYDNSKILKENPGAVDNAASPPWGPYWEAHHWGEPLFGYYLNRDEYILRKHAQMLSDTGVDVLVFDVSNFQPTNPPGAYFKETFLKVMEVFAKVRAEGKRTPDVAFLFNFWAGPYAISQVYEDIYSKGVYRDLWFIWDGKPLVLYDREKVGEDRQDILDFFTFRRPMPDYFYGPVGPDQWAWLNIHPQHGFYSAREPEKVEEVPVGVAQNAVPNPDGREGWTLGCMSERDSRGNFVAMGRSFHNGRQPEIPVPEYGYNFAEQWERALELDPKIVFVTGWNEWIAGRMPKFLHYSAPNVMVDQFDQEYSRDIEPMKGGHTDNYYLQFASYVRKFKGVRPLPRAGAAKTIPIGEGFEEWTEVEPEYRDDIGDALCRKHPGFGQAGLYEDTTGRNDFELMKVARDDQFVYFYAKTVEDITPRTDPDWMVLLIKTDSAKPAWEGFNYIVNRKAAGLGLTVLEACQGGWDWEVVEDGIRYCAAGRELELAIPREALGLEGRPLCFDFKWADNVGLGNDGSEFYVHGDTAPNGRFCYRYQE